MSFIHFMRFAFFATLPLLFDTERGCVGVFFGLSGDRGSRVSGLAEDVVSGTSISPGSNNAALEGCT